MKPIHPYTFFHAHGKPDHSIVGPWKVIGPGIELTEKDRTVAAIMVRSLNEAFIRGTAFEASAICDWLRDFDGTDAPSKVAESIAIEIEHGKHRA